MELKAHLNVGSGCLKCFVWGHLFKSVPYFEAKANMWIWNKTNVINQIRIMKGTVIELLYPASVVLLFTLGGGGRVSRYS